MQTTILVTGGAGYIGSHTCVALAEAGYDPVVVDNFSNSNARSLSRLEQILDRPVRFYEADVRDVSAMSAIMARNPIAAVIHFAGLKAVGESIEQPLNYYDNNVSGTISLCKAMESNGVKGLIFSSSATVYGDPIAVPISEEAPVGAVTNPYGRSKFMVEEILRDLNRGRPDWRIGLLRYFNPVGAHVSGLIGEDPRGTPNNLMPYIAQVAVGRRPHLNVFGGDYPTPDGTGVRDYIHVMDLAEGHVAALGHLKSTAGMFTVNLGTGQGYSVLDMVRAFEKASGRPVPYRIIERRTGDVAQCYADTSYAKKLLGWQAARGLDIMCPEVLI